MFQDCLYAHMDEIWKVPMRGVWNKCLEDQMLYIHDKNDLINFADEQVCVAGIVTVEN